MPNGFIGIQAQKYLSDVTESLDTAILAHSSHPFDGFESGIVPPPVLSQCLNVPKLYEESDEMTDGYSTGVGNSTNIVVDSDEYNRIVDLINEADSRVCEILLKVSEEIKELCENAYTLPDTSPMCMLITDSVKASLGKFRNLSDDVVTNIRSFTTDITSIE